MSEKLTLFDLPSRPPCTTWSLNPWKARMLLNFKGIDYQTQWVEYPDIKDTVKDHVTPNEGGWPYTIPTVKFPDGTWVMDSKKIAEEIEKRYPTPSAHLDSPYQAKIEELVGPLAFATFGLFINTLPRDILNPPSSEYWYKNRAEIVGMSCEQFEKEKGGQSSIDGAKDTLQKVTALYKENKDGPFLEGKNPIYADFQWIGYLVFIQRANPEYWGKLLEATGDAELHKALLTAATPYLARNDH
ncbi:hypothetical protein LIA77_00608 [Sarocladium implicatum]|nr:hypothetical protein LIA77_00608 [Sarocladium implicatum]